MQQVTVDTARTNLPKLIEAALSGEEIVIAKDGKSAVRLVPVVRGKFRIGLLDGQLGKGPDFFKSIGEAELALWEGVPFPDPPS